MMAQFEKNIKNYLCIPNPCKHRQTLFASCDNLVDIFAKSDKNMYVNERKIKFIILVT